MNKSELHQLIDNKFGELSTWIKAQPRNEFAIQKVPNKWSNGEHLEHLRKTTRAINKGLKLPKLMLRFKFGKLKREEYSYDYLIENYLTQLKAQKVKAPASVSPGKIENSDLDRILAWFDQEKNALKKNVNHFSEAQLGKYVLPHPFIGKLSIREFTYFCCLHTEHHLDLMKKYNG